MSHAVEIYYAKMNLLLYELYQLWDFSQMFSAFVVCIVQSYCFVPSHSFLTI